MISRATETGVSVALTGTGSTLAFVTSIAAHGGGVRTRGWVLMQIGAAGLLVAFMIDDVDRESPTLFRVTNSRRTRQMSHGAAHRFALDALILPLRRWNGTRDWFLNTQERSNQTTLIDTRRRPARRGRQEIRSKFLLMAPRTIAGCMCRSAG